ncbi:MAG: hypothetical protein MPEBLZ_00579, partial [Candidatus Methanoperedens nitroreducens]
MYKIGNARSAALIVAIFSIIVMPALAEEAGVINMTRAAETSTHAVSPELITPASSA